MLYPAGAVGTHTHLTGLHLTEDTAGISHFADLRVPLAAGAFAPPAPAMPLSEVEACNGLLYLILPAGWGGAQHPSPRRQVAFCLTGRLRIAAGDGEVRECGAGAIWRMEDVNGSGHTTTVLGREDVRLAIAQLPPLPGGQLRAMLALGAARLAAILAHKTDGGRALCDLQAQARRENARRAVDRLLL